MTHKNDTGQTWKVINDLLSSGNSKSKVTPVEKLCFDSDGRTRQVSSAEEIFVNVGPNLASNIQEDADGRSFRDYLYDQGQDTLNFTPITEYEVQCQLLSLNVNKACGHDTIPARLIRDAADIVAKPLSHIFNLSLRTGKIPKSMKVAKVTLIFKKGDKNNPGNYRPISVLPLFAKILEKMINDRLLDFLEKNEKLYKHQYGFRKKYSTKLSLINLINDVIKSIDKRMVTIGIFIDFKKAFDTINHTILFEKLEHYGVNGVPLQWFRDYLADRFQFVSCNGVL